MSDVFTAVMMKEERL